MAEQPIKSGTRVSGWGDVSGAARDGSVGRYVGHAVDLLDGTRCIFERVDDEEIEDEEMDAGGPVSVRVDVRFFINGADVTGLISHDALQNLLNAAAADRG